MSSDVIPSNQDDLFDILNGDDRFPFLNKVSKESFSVNLDKLIQDEEDNVEAKKKVEKQVVDDFIVDDFLYKNFRFISLNDLNNELSKLNDDLDSELLNLVNNDYNDFIKLGKSINSENFLSLVSSIKLSIVNYHRILESQQDELSSDFQTINSGLFFKKKVSKLIGYLEKSYLLYSLINSFELLINEHSILDKQDSAGTGREYESSSQLEATDVLQQILDVESEKIKDSSLNIQTIKDLTSLYLSIHQLQLYLSSVHISTPKTKPDCKSDLLEVPAVENSFQSTDVVNNIYKLNSITLDNLLNESQDQGLAEQNDMVSNGTEYDEDDLYHHPHSCKNVEKTRFLEDQFKRINKLRLEFKSILDEYLRKINHGAVYSLSEIATGNSTVNSTANGSSANLSEAVDNKTESLKESFLRLKLENVKSSDDQTKAELLELLGIYLILGDEEHFAKIVAERKK